MYMDYILKDSILHETREPTGFGIHESPGSNTTWILRETVYSIEFGFLKKFIFFFLYLTLAFL